MDGDLGRRAFATMAWELDGQLRAAAGKVSGMNLAAEILHDAIRDRQPQAKPLSKRLGGEEWIEDLVDLARRNAWSVVRHFDQNVLPRCLGRDDDSAIFLLVDRVERITHEVEDHLFELDGVAEHPKIRLDFLLDADAGGLDLAFEQEQRAVDGAGDQHRLRMAGLALARERLQVTGDPRHALGKIGNEIKIGYDLREVAAAGEYLRARHEGADRRERLVDLM